VKRWVKEKTVKSVDDEQLQVVQVYESKPKRYDYLVFIQK
jgi:hypothetical protein